MPDSDGSTVLKVDPFSTVQYIGLLSVIPSSRVGQFSVSQ